MRSHSRFIFGPALLALALTFVVGAPTRAVAQTPIPQGGWTLDAVSSEDTCCGDAYRATRGFDGNPSTFWHTVWSTGTPPAPPHAIEINLGASHQVNGFRYLPRQDGVPNGRIGQYQFYVRADGDTYGPPVATGTFANIATQQEVSFAPKTGSHVMLVALTEVEGRPYTSMAELNVLEVTPAPPGSTATPFGFGTVNVRRGFAAPTTIWAAYSTPLGSPLSQDLTNFIGGDNTGGVFRFTCNNLDTGTDPHNGFCEVSVAAAATANVAGQPVLVYPRVLIQRQDYVTPGPTSYCEYGDGSAGAGPAGVLTQTTTPIPTYTPLQIHIGGTADCFGAPDLTAGAVNVITVGPGYYDVFATFVFKKLPVP